MKVAAIFGAGLVIAIVAAPLAHADLVYETDIQPSDRMQDRENFRQVVGTSQKVQPRAQVQQQVALEPTQRIVQVAPVQAAPAPVVAQVQAPQPVYVAPVQQQPVYAAPAVEAQAPVQQPEIGTLSKSELMRRERVREELKNEDIIQERLEELRLRDERRRTNQIFGANQAGMVDPAAAQAPIAPMPMTQEAVVVPVTERPGQPAVQPVYAAPVVVQPVQAQSQAVAPAGYDAGRSTAAASEAAFDAPEEKTIVRISPRAGFANMSNPDSVKVSGRYALGAALSIDASQNMVFELGYTFAEYGLTLNSQYTGFGYYGWQVPNGNYETRALKQNVIDAGMKFYLLNASSKLRPFIGGGGGWQKSFLNYDERYKQATGMRVRDYEASAFLGYLSTGVDVRINKSVSIGTQFRYYSVLSSNSSEQIPYNSFGGYQYNPYALTGYGAGTDPANQSAGVELQRASFYSILAGVTFTF